MWDQHYDQLGDQASMWEEYCDPHEPLESWDSIEEDDEDETEEEEEEDE
jgi:hypothetical protein